MSRADVLNDSSAAMDVTRRQALMRVGMPAAAALVQACMPGMARAAVPTDTITVLYRRDSTTAAMRTEPAAQAALLALQDEFARRGFRVLQPSAETYRLLDQGPALAVSFDPDAGFSMLFSAQRSLRPMPGMDKSLTDVILRCSLLVGHTVLVAEEGRGMMAAGTEADVREFAERRSAEQAAQKAAAVLADKVANRLKALSAADLERLTQPLQITAAPRIDAVAAPAAPPPAAPAASPVPAEAAPAPAPAAPPPLAAPARKFALIVTVSDYSDLRRRLGSSFAIDSLAGVAVDRKNLVDGLKARGFPAENITMLSDAAATSASVRDELGKLVGRTQPDDLVLIAISAHGGPGNMVPSGFGLPVLSDFAPASPGILDFWQLQSMVGNMPARQTVLLVDTCHSGGAAALMTSVVVSAQGVSAQRGRTVTPDPARMAGMQRGDGRAYAVITAASADEVSLEESAGGKGGLFTSTFLRALRDAKGERTLAQLFREQVRVEVMRDSVPMCRQLGCKVQTPQFAYSGRGDQIRL